RSPGRHAEAERLYDRALATYRRLAAEAPTVPDHRYSLAGTLINRGQLLGATNRRELAGEAYRQANTFLEALAAEHPDNPDYRRSQAKTLDSLGSGLVVDGPRKDAEDAYGPAPALDERLRGPPAAAPPP